MFEKLFGSKKPKPGPQKAKPAPPVKLKRVNLARRFSIIAETGQGSMSKVYRAMDNQEGRTVCLKVQDMAKTKAAQARASARLSEGEIGKKINHPHVVRTFDFGQSTKGEYFVSMEFINGMSLNFVREAWGLDLADKVEILAQCAEALAAVHAAGFIHHDYGPKNLLVTQDRFVKLIDFGLAVPNTPEFRRPGNRTGTLNYMAPELLRRESTDERLDIFSFGATAFEFLTGKLPYESSATDPMAVMRTRINADPRKLADAAPHLPGELCELIDKTLVKRPKDRWPRMDTLPDALRELPVASR